MADSLVILAGGVAVDVQKEMSGADGAGDAWHKGFPEKGL
jgi:hypothetical protein